MSLPGGCLPPSGDCSRPGQRGLPAPAQPSLPDSPTQAPSPPPNPHPGSLLCSQASSPGLGTEGPGAPTSAGPAKARGTSSTWAQASGGGGALSHRRPPAHRPHAPRNPEGSLSKDPSQPEGRKLSQCPEKVLETGWRCPEPTTHPSLPWHGGAGGRKGGRMAHPPRSCWGASSRGLRGPVLHGHGAPRAVPTLEPLELQAKLTFCPYPARPGAKPRPAQRDPADIWGAIVRGGGRLAVRSRNSPRAGDPQRERAAWGANHCLRSERLWAAGGSPETTFRLSSARGADH